MLPFVVLACTAVILCNLTAVVLKPLHLGFIANTFLGAVLSAGSAVFLAKVIEPDLIVVGLSLIIPLSAMICISFFLNRSAR